MAQKDFISRYNQFSGYFWLLITGLSFLGSRDGATHVFHQKMDEQTHVPPSERNGTTKRR
jgi:hypothetical protein